MSAAMIQSARAVRLAWQTTHGYITSHYGYVDPSAATKAAPVLNRVRTARGNPQYTHMVEYAGNKLVEVRPLEGM